MCRISNYGCEVLGSHKGHNIEKVHLEFLRFVIGVRKTTNPLMGVYLYISFVFIECLSSGLKYCSQKIIYEELLYDWSYCICKNKKKNYKREKFIKDQFNDLGLGYMWNDVSNLYSRVCLPIIRKRLKDNFIQTFYSTQQDANRKKVFYLQAFS